MLAGEVSDVKVDQLVAVQCENCDLEPLIGRVLHLGEDDISLVWLEGEYSKPWKVAKVQAGS